MFATVAMIPASSGARWLRDELLAVSIGIGFTVVLFSLLARFEHFESAPVAVPVEEVMMSALVIEPPPPPPTEWQATDAPPDGAVPTMGIAVEANDSPVSIAVLPPDLETVIPVQTNAPQAHFSFNALRSDFRPGGKIDVEFNRVYQESEVDERPHAIVRTTPQVPPELTKDVNFLRVTLLLTVDTKGRVESARVLRGSGVAQFDDIVARALKDDWLFSPAVRKGKKVRVLAQQVIRVNFTSGSSVFEVK